MVASTLPGSVWHYLNYLWIFWNFDKYSIILSKLLKTLAITHWNFFILLLGFALLSSTCWCAYVLFLLIKVVVFLLIGLINDWRIRVFAMDLSVQIDSHYHFQRAWRKTTCKKSLSNLKGNGETRYHHFHNFLNYNKLASVWAWISTRGKHMNASSNNIREGHGDEMKWSFLK
jgi:hypothetical protein